MNLNRELIVETDLGHDPDDLFALCWLASAGVSFKLILLSGGAWPYQVALAKYLLLRVGCEAPVGVPPPKPQTRRNRGAPTAAKEHVDPFHGELLARHGWPTRMAPDGLGPDLLREVLHALPSTPVFACGPMDSIGAYLEMGGRIESLTIQGGFAPYELHSPSVRLPKFEGKKEVPSFNLNGNSGAAQRVFAAPGMARRVVGKNVCHTVVYDRVRHEQVMAANVQNEAMGLFRKAMSQYLERGRHEDKKFHDPVAAVVHLHPEIGAWIRGRPYKASGAWGTQLDPEGDQVLVDIDHDRFWQHIITGI